MTHRKHPLHLLWFSLPAGTVHCVGHRSAHHSKGVEMITRAECTYIDGDRLAGWKTLPVVVSERNSRYATADFMAACPPIFRYAGLFPKSHPLVKYSEGLWFLFATYTYDHHMAAALYLFWQYIATYLTSFDWLITYSYCGFIAIGSIHDIPLVPAPLSLKQSFLLVASRPSNITFSLFLCYFNLACNLHQNWLWSGGSKN
ncbi:hypothetical protein B0H10DRAFT_2008363 [Mycena sp. CBHHK59/15]|nr:hypothetical protein B0H10DRAFT_2008363 [Mycena sp. CBHHK59/15]